MSTQKIIIQKLQGLFEYIMLGVLFFTIPPTDLTTNSLIQFMILLCGAMFIGGFTGVMLSDLDTMNTSKLQQIQDKDIRQPLFLFTAMVFGVYTILVYTNIGGSFIHIALGVLALLSVNVLLGYSANTRFRNEQQPFQKYDWYPDRLILYPLAPLYGLRYYLENGHL